MRHRPRRESKKESIGITYERADVLLRERENRHQKPRLNCIAPRGRKKASKKRLLSRIQIRNSERGFLKGSAVVLPPNGEPTCTVVEEGLGRETLGSERFEG